MVRKNRKTRDDLYFIGGKAVMQIKELIIYGRNGKIRRLPFNLGMVNIITGKNKAGKSAVGTIIDYCLGGTFCNIADGVVRDYADWYALLLQFDNEQVFVARKNPLPSQQSTGYCYVQIGKEIIVPATCNFTSNQNVSGIEELLSKRLGISENMNTPPDGQSRPPLSANIRHALFYCFQNQDEIASPKILFHRQQEDFVTQSIKDTLPYFLGVVNEESLALEHERTLLKRQLVIEKRRLEENLLLRGGGRDRAVSLISESKEVGLLTRDLIVDYDDYDALKSVLESVDEWTPKDIASVGMDRLTSLQTELADDEKELEALNTEIESAKLFANAGSGYEDSVKHQAMRLSSIGLFEHLDFLPNHCPLCSGDLGENALPHAESIKNALMNLNRDIESIEREHPKIRKYLDGLENDRQKLREKIRSLRTEIDGIYEQNQNAKVYRDLMARRAKVAGRISLWLDSMNEADNFTGKKETIDKLQARINVIDGILNRDDLEERQASALSRISVNMSQWAKELKLEHGDNPYRLDMGRVTVMVDKPERPIPLNNLGSGANWVGVHLITYLAVQKFFIEASRPVPHFIFIDQPSQVYFPSEHAEQKQDWEMIRELYQFIFKRVEELNGRLQLIIVDHANLDRDWFINATVEDWHSETNLIPTDWYDTATPQ
jgi:hypothetical protein